MGKKILVVDDSAETRKIIALRLVMHLTNAKVAPEKNAGVIKGNVILLKVLALVAPRFVDDSSISLEIWFKAATPDSMPMGILRKI